MTSGKTTPGWPRWRRIRNEPWVLEYGVRAPVFYGNLREQTGESGFLRIPTGILFCSYRNLEKSPETSGSLRDNVISESCIPVPSWETWWRTFISTSKFLVSTLRWKSTTVSASPQLWDNSPVIWRLGAWGEDAYTGYLTAWREMQGLYYAILYYAILCHTIPYHTIPYYTIIYYVCFSFRF